MKFAHEFKDALVREGFPTRWVESAVPYGQLKKCIKKVESELRSLGLDSATLAQLMPPTTTTTTTYKPNNPAGESPVAFQYDFDGNKTQFRPKLTLFVQVKDGLAIDATLSPATRQYLERLVSTQGQNVVPYVEAPETVDVESPLAEYPPILSPEDVYASDTRTKKPVVQRIEVPLTFDSEFFGILQGDVTNLDKIQAVEQKALSEEILALSTEVTTLTRPTKYGKTDLYRWRQLFDIYLQAGVFFSMHEFDHGRRNSKMALKQLQWFQNEVMKEDIVGSFKMTASHQALERFVKINVTLLRNLKFQEINQLAITKILKKFDKRTKLGATRTFHQLIQSGSIMSETMAKAVCSQVSHDLVKIVPQVDDYLCPICFTISWRPIRLKCKHIFCIRCTIRMQKEKKMFCPLCRGQVIMDADQDNIDDELASFLKKYFPKETRQKQIELETAAGIEQFGIYYKHPSETKCLMM
ncbi:hypothetical protein PVAG01_02971 [Phlyctema vagabunda]|uniref:RING-14 protein n=1 Tax=Phlyctema vagabunda TaxID=108571 RepID=A0ABR4PS79_9HELO